ncbi:flagellar hook-length control protein FliK [Shewanella maritima]|uniref:flagellar hook-length control protein FliK n=1 Tax=Shewanella maritima TaxID=2520507 RepID=UPI003735C78C
MQQMGNFLLGESTKISGKTAINVSKSDTNQEFTELFHQANNALLTDANQAELTSAAKDQLLQDGKMITLPIDELQSDNLDVEQNVELVFAQIDMAEHIKLADSNAEQGSGTIVSDGKTLPLSGDTTEDETLTKQIAQLSNTVKADDTIIPQLNASQTSQEYLSSLSHAQSSKLIALSGQSFTELGVMTKAELTQLVSNLSQQKGVAQVSGAVPLDNVSFTQGNAELMRDTSLVQNSEKHREGLPIDRLLFEKIPVDKVSVDKLTAQNVISDKSQLASGKESQANQANKETGDSRPLINNVQVANQAEQAQSKVLSNQTVDLNAMKVDKTDAKVIAEVATLSSQMSTQNVKQTTNTQASSLSIPNAILGEKSVLELATKADVTSVNKLELGGDKPFVNTEISVVMRKVASAPLANVESFIPKVQSEIAHAQLADDTVELSSLQNQSSSNNLIKTDVPQVQLSLRQQADANVSMQQMIQRFAPVMKQQLMSMVSKGIGQAEIRLDPPELGSMMVKIQVQGDQTQVQFQVAQSQTRDVLEQALPRLREMLEQQGLALADSHVSQQGQSGQQDHREESAGHTQGEHIDETTVQESVLMEKSPSNSHSGIDYYA